MAGTEITDATEHRVWPASMSIQPIATLVPRRTCSLMPKAKRRNTTRAIYGAVTEQEAENYWRHMAKKGWQLRRTPGEGMSVHKSMSS